MHETNRPLVLQTGMSRRGRLGAAAFVLMPVVTLSLVGDAPNHYRLMYAILVVAVILALVARDPKYSGGTLVIDAAGDAALMLRNGPREPVILGQRHWLSSALSSVQVRVEGQYVNLLILPAGQEPGAYRRMLVLLRHRTDIPTA